MATTHTNLSDVAHNLYNNNRNEVTNGVNVEVTRLYFQ